MNKCQLTLALLLGLACCGALAADIPPRVDGSVGAGLNVTLGDFMNGTIANMLNGTMGMLNQTLANATAAACKQAGLDSTCTLADIACKQAGIDKDKCAAALNGTVTVRQPRGDDDRPRSWGVPNSRGETEFDDRKSPRKVALLGRSAIVRIYPNYSDPSVYLTLKFGKVVELDSQGRPVRGHYINSLADASSAVTIATGNVTIGNVVSSFANVSVQPAMVNGFRSSCGTPSPSPKPSPSPSPSPSPTTSSGSGSGSGSVSVSGSTTASAGGRRMLLQTAPAPTIDVSLLFGMNGSLSLPYGDATLSIPANGLKFSVLVRNWPFCNVNNTLRVSLQLMLANNASATTQPVDSGSSATVAANLKIQLGTNYTSYLSFLNYALDGMSGKQQMPVSVSVLAPNASASVTASSSTMASANATVNGTTASANVSASASANATASASGGSDDDSQEDQEDRSVTQVVMLLPNPAKYNATAVYYDPTQTTTSAYLSATDPANTASLTVTGTTGGGGGSGAASGVRMSAMALLAAFALSFFML